MSRNEIDWIYLVRCRERWQKDCSAPTCLVTFRWCACVFSILENPEILKSIEKKQKMSFAKWNVFRQS